MTRHSFMERGKNDGKGSRTPYHRRARQMEEELAKETGGKLTPGSGNGNVKGDIQNAYGCIRIEAKTTKNKSFSVTRDMVRKIEDAALPNGELPAIVVEFMDIEGKPEMSIAVVPTYLLQGIADAHKQ